MGAFRRRISATATALGIGGLAAWPFYHDQAGRSAPASIPSTTASSEVAAVVPMEITANEQIPARIIATQAVTTDSLAQVGLPALPAEQPTLPNLQGSFPRSETQVPAARQIVTNRKSVASAPVTKTVGDVEPARTHRLKDGDTLEELAERFLGDRSRATELFEANRGVLTSADLLPIGKEIHFPATKKSAALGAASPELVPIPWSPAAEKSDSNGRKPHG